MTIREDRLRSMVADKPSVYRNPFLSLKAAAVWLSEWFADCADHYAAARMYECLSKLSDAELERRGFGRATLAHDLISRCDRTGESSAATIEKILLEAHQARSKPCAKREDQP